MPGARRARRHFLVYERCWIFIWRSARTENLDYILMYKNLILPASILTGAIIGAGVFALPYLTGKAGLLAGLFYLIIFADALTLIHLMYVDIIRATDERHRFTGYAQIYLGNIGKWLTLVVTIFGMILILTVYLILGISFINLIYPSLILQYKLLIFWLLASLPIFWSIRQLAFSELLATYGIAAIIFAIFIYGIGNIGELFKTPLLNLAYGYLPYGAMLFALSGRVAIPAVADYFRKRKKPVSNAKSAIIIGTAAPAFIYLMFIIGILSLGNNTSEDAVSGLIGHLPIVWLWLLGILGLTAIWSTYIVVGQDIAQSLELDFKLPKILALLTVLFAPLLLYFAGLKDFLGLVSLVGGVFIGLESILIILMWKKIPKSQAKDVMLKKLNPVTLCALLLIFVLGIITTVIGRW